MHFSSVDLPEPFWPMTPNTSPSLTSKVTSFERGELVEPVAPLAGDELLDRVRLLVVEAEGLGDVVDLECAAQPWLTSPPRSVARAG